MAAIPVTSGLQLLLDARSITGLNDGDAIASWNDNSGNGNNASQSTAANRLVYKTNIYGSNPAARCDATNKQIGGSYSSWTGGTGATLFVCLSNIAANTSPNNSRWFSTAASGGNDASNYMIGLGPNYEFFVSGASRAQTTNFNNTTAPTIIGGAIDSSRLDSIINGTFRANVSHAVTLPSSTQSVFATGRIGSGAMTGDLCSLGDFHFLISYSRRLTLTEIHDVCSWMRSELGMETAGGGAARPLSPFYQGVIG